MLLGGIFEFESPIPQSSASAATGAQPITAIVKRQRCISAYKFFAAPETAAAVRPRNYQSQPVGKTITQQCATGEEIFMERRPISSSRRRCRGRRGGGSLLRTFW